MTLTNRLRSIFLRASSSSALSDSAVAPPVKLAPQFPVLQERPATEPLITIHSAIHARSESLPGWLADEESLRDEGVLFGLSDARPDSKLDQIRAYFGQQSASVEEQIEQHTEKIGELNLFIEQRENRITALREQISDLNENQPVPNNLVRHVVSLALSVVLCIGNFYLIDETLRPMFANRWIAVGVFIAGMFNLFGRTSFFYETDTRLTGRRLVEELSLPLATSIFVLVQALQSQSIGQSIGLFVFVFFLFLLAGKLVLSTLTSLQTDVSIIQRNRQLSVNKVQNMPRWEADIERLGQEIDGIRIQKWSIVTTLNHLQAEVAHLNTQRDGLVNLFISEFELARSLRNRLTEQQRNSIITGSPERL